MGRQRSRDATPVSGPPTPVPLPPRKGATTPNPRKKMPAKHNPKGYKYDWFDLKTKFVEGYKTEGSDEREFVNLKELAERESIPLQRVRERAADERWYEQRESYQLRMIKARQAKRVLELAGESVDFDSKSLDLAKLGIGMVTARLAEIAREVQESQRRREEALKLQAAGFDANPKDLKTVIQARELDMLSKAAVQFQEVGQKALGTDITRMEITQDIHTDIDVDVHVTSISAELSRDDPERLAAFLQAAKRAGLLDTVLSESQHENHPAIESGEVVEAEIVETTDEG